MTALFGLLKRARPEQLEMESVDTIPRVKAPRKKRALQTDNQKKILTYLKETEGKNVRSDVLAAYMGYSDPSRVSGLIREMRRKGTIKITGGNGMRGFIYQVNRPTVRRKSKSQKRREQFLDDTVGERKLLRFIEERQGRFLTQAYMGQALGVTPSRISQIVTKLVKEGRLERSTPVYGEGTRYRIPGNTLVPDSKDSPNVVPMKKPEPDTPHNDNRLLVVLEPLVWDFIRSTHSVNVLDFKEWLLKNKR